MSADRPPGDESVRFVRAPGDDPGLVDCFLSRRPFGVASSSSSASSWDSSFRGEASTSSSLPRLDSEGTGVRGELSLPALSSSRPWLPCSVLAGDASRGTSQTHPLFGLPPPGGFNE